jgi:hypothetical protein
MIFVSILGLIGLIEVIGGISILAHSNTVFNEIEGLVMAGFGVLTVAVTSGAGAIYGAVGKLQKATQTAAKPQE